MVTVPIGGGRTVPWDDATGRVCRGAAYAGDVLDLVAVRSWWTLHLPARPALWAPDPLRPGPGGPPFRALPLTAQESRLWSSLNDARTLQQAAVHARVPDTVARGLAARLTKADVQALQLHPSVPSPRYRGARTLWGPPRPRHARSVDQHDAQGATTLGAFHDNIVDADGHFDDRETTVAHAFAEPHAALGGERYGARLCGALHREGLMRAGLRIVEVGPGTGELARDFWAAAATEQLPADYLRIDRSPGLLDAQALRCPESRGLRGDACALPLSDESVDLLLNNEVIADLSAVLWDGHERSALHTEVAQRVARYGLEVLPGAGPYNLGAWQLLEEIGRVLVPGGGAFITEFGAVDELPQETTHLDHPEVSIHFGHLMAVARGLGLSARLVPLHVLLQADLGARWLGRPGHAALRALHHAAGQRLAARAWTAASAPTPEVVQGLRDVAIVEDGPGPVITRFPALLIGKPSPASLSPARSDRRGPASA